MMPPDYYFVLEDGVVRPARDLEDFVECMEHGDRDIGKDMIVDADGILVHISTVFLGLNHAFRDGPPILFETMIFGGVHDMDAQRYCTIDEAKQGHAEMVEFVKSAPTDHTINKPSQ